MDRGSLEYVHFHSCPENLKNNTVMTVKLKSEIHTMDPYEMIVTSNEEDDTRCYRIRDGLFILRVANFTEHSSLIMNLRDMLYDNVTVRIRFRNTTFSMNNEQR